ncbi:hypothetical protein NXH76_14025 [Blautia schinkii]|nr:hypothetical protein [Blautia schinkii]
MEYMYKTNLQKTISEFFPAYLKKKLLKQAVNDGLVINNRKKTSQLSLNFADIIDVSEYDSLDEKVNNILQVDSILQFIEEFEYKRQYRHFCYFKCSEIASTKIEELVKQGSVNLFDKKGNCLIDEYTKPSLYIVDNLVYLKFSNRLNNDTGNQINFIVICVLDKEHNIIELRFDRVGIAYKNSYNFYRDKINEILQYLSTTLGITIDNIDFKAVIDYMKMEKDNISIYAQRMQRNGTTDYLEAYDDGDGVMPILGELGAFIKDNKELFDTDINTTLIRDKLEAFIKEIEIKSDMPMVKVKLDDCDIKFGITHNYKGTDYSLFMFYGELLGDKEVMSYVRNYLIGCNQELEILIQSNSVPKQTM